MSGNEHSCVWLTMIFLGVLYIFFQNTPNKTMVGLEVRRLAKVVDGYRWRFEAVIGGSVASNGGSATIGGGSTIVNGGPAVAAYCLATVDRGLAEHQQWSGCRCWWPNSQHQWLGNHQQRFNSRR